MFMSSESAAHCLSFLLLAEEAEALCMVLTTVASARRIAVSSSPENKMHGHYSDHISDTTQRSPKVFGSEYSYFLDRPPTYDYAAAP
jgi:hypothetical protein